MRRKETVPQQLAQQPTVSLSLDLSNGRDDLNLAEYPLFSVGKFSRSITKLQFESQVRDRRTGRHLCRTVTLTSYHGIPTAGDADILFALIALAKQQNDFSQPEVFFDTPRLIDELGWPLNGKSYGRIKEALRRWDTLTIEYENWWDREAKEFRYISLHVLDGLNLAAAKSGRRAKETKKLSSVRFAADFLAELQKGNLRRLDLEMYYRLKTPAAKQIYRFLGKRFYHQDDLSFDLEQFAFEHVGLSRNYPVRDIKRKLKPAIKELEELGQIKPLSPRERFTKLRPNVYEVRFDRGPKFTISGKPIETNEHPLLFDPPLVAELVKHGVTRLKARRLVDDESIDDGLIAEKIELLEWQQNENAEAAPDNPGGWLVKAILDDFAPPPNFVTKAQRKERAERAARETKRRRNEAAKKQKLEDQEAEARREEARQKWERVEAYLDALPSSQRQQTIEAAIAAAADTAKPFAIAYLNKPEPGMKEMNYQVALQNYVFPLIENPSAKRRRKAK